MVLPIRNSEEQKFLKELYNKYYVTKLDVTDDLKSLLLAGENDYVEFKSSLRWDYRQNKLNKKLEIPIAKTIAAFLNSEGGKLIIGVDDNGNILDLSNDYSTFSKKNKDGFQQTLVGIINKYLGKELHQYISITIKKINTNEICLVNISKSNTPVFLEYQGMDIFYIRASCSSQPLGLRESLEYINSH